MATKVDTGSAVELHPVQSSIAMSTSTVSANSPKVSRFGAKSGFVIPKNKLSGSLVPIFRGSEKVEAGNTGKEESAKQVPRKTKWGADLTQDVAVIKGRALAYQTRVEQINQQLKSGALDMGDNKGLQSPTRASNHDSARNLLDVEPPKRELLELERRELIGELLRLNPSYKAPPDYKPLLKDAKVPIPLKAYPGYNFLVLILGPESDTQKRLEKETGAKIRVHGIKADTGEKREIAQSDITDAQAAYEDLYVHVSADTYEKVDAAVALIELLVTPVSVNPAVASTSTNSTAEDSSNISDPSQKDAASGYAVMLTGAVNQGLVPQMVVPAQPGPQQFQAYSGPWYPPNIPNSTIRLPTGFIPPPVPNNSFRFPPSPVNPLNMPAFYGGHPGPVPRNSSSVMFRPQPPMQVLQRPQNQVVSPSTYTMPSQQPPQAHPAMPSQPTSNLPASFSPAPQAIHVGPMPTSGPSVPSPQQVSMAPRGSLFNRPLTTSIPLGNPSGWSSVPSSAPQPLRPSNVMQMTSPQLIAPQRPHPVVLKNPIASVSSLPNLSAPVVSRPQVMNFTPPSAFCSAPPQVRPIPAPAVVPSSVKPLVPPVPAPTFLPSPVPSPLPRPLPVPAAAPSGLPSVLQMPASVNTYAPVSAQASVPTQSASRPPVSVPSVVPGASTPAPPVVPPPQLAPAMSGSVSGGLPIFSPMKPSAASGVSRPPITALKPQPPSSGDFTFQPLRAQVPVSLASSGPNPSSVVQNTPQVPRAAPQAPSFRPAVQNTAMSVGRQVFLRPQAGSHRGPPQAPMPPPPPASVVPLPINPNSARPPVRHPTFPSPQHVSPRAPATQAGPPSFFPARQALNLPGSMLVRPPTLMQPHNQVMPTSQPHNQLATNQQLSDNHPGHLAGKHASSPGVNQIYDPFSPTSISSAPARLGDDQSKVRKLETDTEYEDLMASVGLR